MKTIIKTLVMLFTVFALNNAVAGEDITGIWQGELVPAPGAEITIQFIISQEADGAYAVVLTSPEEGGIKDIQANEVVYDAGRLKLEVAELSGSYEGTAKGGTIEGEWTQQGISMPLNLSPYVKPTLTAEDKEKLLGEWFGDLEIPIGTITLVFRFETSESGEFAGFLDIPDQNATGLPVTDMEKTDDGVVLKLSSLRAEISGKLTEDEFIGEFKQGAEPLPLTMKKGTYTPPMDEFKLSEEDKAVLSGEWYGEINTPATPVAPANAIAVVVRFETTEDGQFKGYTDSPDQGGYDIPITSLEVNGQNIVFKVRSLFSEFSGTLSDTTMVGEHKQGPSTLPLTFTKGKYVAPVHSLNLPEEAMAALAGKWCGDLGPATLVFRFEKSGADSCVAFIDIPNQKVKGVPVTEATFTEGELSIRAAGINTEFKGKLSGKELAGQWIPAGNTIPLSLTKE